MSVDQIYSTEFLVTRLYDELNSNKSKANKLILSRPEVVILNKKTFVKNFCDMCKMLNRSEIEVQQYFSDELMKKTSIDSKGGLVVWGIFRQRAIESIIKNYIQYYVTCKECGSSSTNLIKESRISYLACDKCLSKKAV